MVIFWLLVVALFMLKNTQTSVILKVEAEQSMDPAVKLDPAATLECHRRLYTHRVTQADSAGKQCWDTISVLACWGRCDSKEISDWRFPYKRSSHPVCVHHGRTKALVTLRNCEEGTDPSAARYEYMEAASCRCQTCSSSDTSCEGLRYRPQRSSQPEQFGFKNNQ